LISSVQIALKEKSVMIFFYSIVSFLTLHVSYGVGSLWALIRSMAIPKQRIYD